MSRFYASIQGNRGEATRMGTVKTGIEGHVRGWNTGVQVICSVNEKDEDVIDICITGGSNGGISNISLATIEGNKVTIYKKSKFTIR